MRRQCTRKFLSPTGRKKYPSKRQRQYTTKGGEKKTLPVTLLIIVHIKIQYSTKRACQFTKHEITRLQNSYAQQTKLKHAEKPKHGNKFVHARQYKPTTNRSSRIRVTDYSSGPYWDIAQYSSPDQQDPLHEGIERPIRPPPSFVVLVKRKRKASRSLVSATQTVAGTGGILSFSPGT